MALLYRDFDKRVEIRSTRDGLIRYHRYAEAVRYLRQNRDRPGLADALRRELARHSRIEVAGLSDDEVMQEVERRLLHGSLQLMEMFEPKRKGRTTPPAEEAQAEPIIVPAAAAAAAVEAPAAPPLLPLLEEVQIEGAEVLPEIMQTLEQIDLTMAGINLAGVSLEPAPSGVPAIGAAMQQASSSITASLGAM